MTDLHIKDLTKKFGNTVALEDFSLEIKSGELMVLLGPSGCGKTTVLRCIAGLTTPTRGQIYIGDRLANDLPPKDRDVAMVFQNYSLYPHMNVYDNIGFPLRLRKTEKRIMDQRIKEIALVLDIKHLLDRKPRELSGGQMQRVALGRALVRNPKIFLMDEPLSNLDAKLRSDMRVEIKKLQKKVGVTTLYITHDQAEAMSLADNLGVMERGKLMQVGLPESVYNRPRNRFVASFLGMPPMNFVECNIFRKGSEIFITIAGGDDKNEQTAMFDIPETLLQILNNKQLNTLTLGVRPKDIMILRENEVFEGLNVDGEVSFREQLGDDSIAEIKIGKDTMKISNIDPLAHNLEIGKKVKLGIDQNKICFFDASGNRLS
jgi:multiple sugar transport system ATP-binding protein